MDLEWEERERNFIDLASVMGVRSTSIELARKYRKIEEVCLQPIKFIFPEHLILSPTAKRHPTERMTLGEDVMDTDEFESFSFCLQWVRVRPTRDFHLTLISIRFLPIRSILLCHFNRMYIGNKFQLFECVR